MARPAICPCGYTFSPRLTYDGAPWSGRPRKYCSRKCARTIPASARRHERAQAKLRAKNLLAEMNGQQTLFPRAA